VRIADESAAYYRSMAPEAALLIEFVRMGATTTDIRFVSSGT
jgi:hypothetical protein